MDKTVFHSGDLGDIIYSLPTIKKVGGAHIHVHTRPWTKVMSKDRFETVSALLLDQPYVAGVSFGEPPTPPDIDFSQFRSMGMPWGRNISDLHSRFALGEEIPYEPWLQADPDPATQGRVLVHRSPRYRNHSFDWRGVVNELGDTALSICFPEEHAKLEEICGHSIERIAVTDFHHLAGLIKGSQLFVGNQSSPMAVAIGLGHPAVQETCLWIPDCIYPGAPIQYVTNGRVELGGKILNSPTRILVSEKTTPPGGWLVSLGGQTSKHLLLQQAAKALRSYGFEGDPRAEAIEQNTNRILDLYPRFLGHGRENPGRLEAHLRAVLGKNLEKETQRG